MRRRGLGINITPDVTDDFFSIKTNPVAQRYDKHHVGSSTSFASQTNSGGRTPRLPQDEGRYYEQQLVLNSTYDNEYDPLSYQPNKQQPVNELLLPEPEDEAPNMEQPISIEVYDNYSFNHEYDTTLPITDHRVHVVQTIEANRATVIKGSTGSGKTTQVPQYILDEYQKRRKYCNILVTQPRRIAAMSVAKRVCQERDWPLGSLVGYQVARDRKVTEDTRITYMTTGVLLQKLIKNKNLGEYTHVFLDEVHERDQDIDFSMLVVRKYLRTVSKHVKIVLMSATVDCSLFSNYFSILINGEQEEAPVISVEGRMFDVTEYYFEDIAGLSEPPQQSIYEPEISEKCYQLCRQLIVQLDRSEMKENYGKSEFPENRGTVLCFLPGLPEIVEMHKHLTDLETEKNLKVMVLHSQISSRDQVLVFVPSERRQRKIILATNIAESSITVPDIRYVIDFCLTKNNETDRETNYQRLTLQWASKASLTQRKGRAGRVSEGHCFRMISASFVNQLFDYCVPEMLRSPLEQIVLKVKLLELGSPAQTLRLAIQPPDITDIKRTILMLKEVGAITVRQNGRINPLDGDLTFVGRVLGSLPVDVHIGKLLLIGYAFGVVEECLVIGACLSLKSIFSKPFRNDMGSYTNKMYWAKYSNSDLLASFHAFLSWKFRKEHIGFGEPEKKWAQKNFLEYKRLYEVNELARELSDRLKNFNIIPYRDIFKRDELSNEDQFIIKLVIAGAFYPNYFHSQEIEEEVATKTMSGHNSFTTVVVHGAPSTLCHYRANVASLFRQCGRGKRMYFENTRAFIEFENDANGESPVSSAVYKAIKMRHLRIPLSIFVSKKKDDNYRHELVNAPIESFNPETGLRTNRVYTGLHGEGKLSVTLTGNPMQVKLKDYGYMNIIVQEVITPGHFWATYGDADSRQQMLQLHNKLNALGGRNLKPMHSGTIKSGAYCLALFEDEFFRAEIVECTARHVKVFFLDFGNSAYVMDKNQIRQCSDALLEIPFQAFECHLSQIRPVHGTWSDEATLRFKEIVEVGSAILIAKIYSLIHGAYRLELFRDDDSINRRLILDGHATACEEPLHSKNRHAEMEKTKGISRQANQTGQFIKDGSKVEKGEEVLKITLRGPFSPYEMSFFGLTASGRLRATRVEQDSVNSVVICDEPQDKHARMIVAAAININSSGNTMIARETTYLPNIHGLTAMIPLMFAPVSEFRLNKSDSAISGAICGLGCDDSGASILPDHDIEIPFDVQFNDFDSGMINGIRMLINNAIGIDGEKIELPAHQIATIQKHLRVKLMECINKQRDDIEPMTCRNEYQWNQVKPEAIIDCGWEEKPTHLYSYHKGIFIPEKKQPIDDRILQQQHQLNKLHKMAGNSLMPFNEEVVCPLCQVKCRHPRGLYLHCETQQHRNWVEQIFKIQPS